MANSITADKQLIMLGSLLDSFISECEAAKQDLACIHNIPVEKIDLFPDHPYYVDNDEDMANLVRSIKAIGVLDVMDNREEKWTKEVNLVVWNGGKPKIDIRDWNEKHDRMSRGITLTEEQGEKLVKALGQRMLDKQKARTERDPYER